MIDLHEVAKNPAYSLSAMLYGLQNPIETKYAKYKVDMNTYGKVVDHYRDRIKVCHGCAATSAIEVLTGRYLTQQFRSYDVHGDHLSLERISKIFDADFDSLTSFQLSINAASSGELSHIMWFFNITGISEWDLNYSYDLDNVFIDAIGWQEEVPTFENVINKMHEDYPEWERFPEGGLR